MVLFIDGFGIFGSESGEVLALRQIRNDDGWSKVLVSEISQLNQTRKMKISTMNETGQPCYDLKTDLPTVRETNKNNFVIAQERKFEGLIFACVVSHQNEVIAVLELMEHIYRVFLHYLKEVNEETLKACNPTVQLLLSEMIDGGIVGVLEPGVLEGYIPHPSGVNKLISAVTDKILSDEQTKNSLNRGVTSVVSAISSAIHGQNGSQTDSIFASDDVWWRRARISHTSNEIYLDVVERLDAIVTSSGRVVNWSIAGNLNVMCKLSGNLPDVTLVVKEPVVSQSNKTSDPNGSPGSMFSWGLHACVKKQRWMRDKVFSFVPPDGEFSLAKYAYAPAFAKVVSGPVTECPMPINVQGKAEFDRDGGKLEMTVALKLAALKAQGEKILEPVILTMKVPACIGSVTATCKQGIARFEKDDRKLVWHIGKMSTADLSALKLEASAKYIPGIDVEKAAAQANECLTVINADFTLKSHTMTGLKVDSLDVAGVQYTPYKGVRYSTRAGKIEFRL